MQKLSLSKERIKISKITPKLKANKFTVLILTAVLAISAAPATTFAQTINEKINQLTKKNEAASAQRQALTNEEESLSARIASLQASTGELSRQIGEQQAKSETITKKIADTETEINKQKALLGESVRELYLEGQISTIEMLVTSKNLSDYANKEQYRVAASDQIKSIVDRVKELKKQQEKQKKEVETILAEQKARHEQLAKDQAEAARLLSLNTQQQSEYNQQISANNSQIARLRAEQAALNARSFVGGISYGGSGGYPWAGVPFPNTMPDPWGMYKRQCVSYTAWKVASSGRYMPYWGGRGNAKLWDDNARAAGIPVSSTPKVGSVAVDNNGTYGHVMYVEAIHGDGTISISQYNAGWDGRYSEGRRSVSGLVFVHF